MLLADIGNSYFHLFDKDKKIIKHLEFKELDKYKEKEVFYICVNPNIETKIKEFKCWHKIDISLNGEYKGMGIDRKALCLNYENGLFIDAGSAITIDKMKNAEYKGGTILLGLKAHLKAYENISIKLKTTLNKNISLNNLPKNTQDNISYAILEPLKLIIEKEKEKNIYFTGGDGKFLSRLFKNAIYDEFLVFKGMQKAVKKGLIC